MTVGAEFSSPSGRLDDCAAGILVFHRNLKPRLPGKKRRCTIHAKNTCWAPFHTQSQHSKISPGCHPHGVELRINRDTVFSAYRLYNLWRKDTSSDVFCIIAGLTRKTDALISHGVHRHLCRALPSCSFFGPSSTSFYFRYSIINDTQG